MELLSDLLCFFCENVVEPRAEGRVFSVRGYGAFLWPLLSSACVLANDLVQFLSGPFEPCSSVRIGSKAYGGVTLF